MKINIYCDESCHLEHDNINTMVLGGVWCPLEAKEEAFRRLREIKVKHGLKPFNELKWNGVSPSKEDYYKDVMDYFFDNQDLHFRALVVPDKQILHHEDYAQTHDQFYYKMYFDMLKALIVPNNQYYIYLDIKDSQGGKKVRKLRDILCSSALDFDKKIIKRIQQVKSHEVELIELADFLIGTVTYANRGLTTSETKLKLLEKMRQRSSYSLTKSTLLREDKVNIFIWRGGVAR